MKNLFLIDGASGTGKTYLIKYIDEFKSDRGLVKKYSTRAERAYERSEDWKLDLIFVSEDEFDDLKLDYQYRYAGNRYGFSKKDLNDALTNNTNVFVIVRNTDLIRRLQKEFYFINVVTIFVYADQDLIKKRLFKLKEEGTLTEQDINLRLTRLGIAFRDYLNHPEIYSDVIINNASESDFQRLIETTLLKYRRAPDIEEKLVFLLMAFNRTNPALQDYGAAIKRAVRNADPTARCLDLEDIKRGSYEISAEAKSQIRRCRLAIVDLTENRPNVYYELGFVHGIGKDCILTSHVDSEPHFYPAGHKIIFYKNASELEGRLMEELTAFFGTWTI